MTQVTIELARTALQNQPFSQLPGAELTRFDSIAELHLPMKKALATARAVKSKWVLSQVCSAVVALHTSADAPCQDVFTGEAFLLCLFHEFLFTMTMQDQRHILV